MLLKLHWSGDNHIRSKDTIIALTTLFLSVVLIKQSILFFSTRGTSAHVSDNEYPVSEYLCYLLRWGDSMGRCQLTSADTLAECWIHLNAEELRRTTLKLKNIMLLLFALKSCILGWSWETRWKSWNIKQVNCCISE